ncbi:MAG: membrane protein insertion efficiency factor YidD [Deltaproteobacteria bacterium]|nr:membrane protein insertion efficiency factor YidD [Deltaproteobacteria bacterium]
MFDGRSFREKKLFSWVLIILIQFYQIAISPWKLPSCRFFPSCSQYAIDVIRKHGAIKGTFYTIIRVLKCHPFHPGGYDPAN